MESTTGPEGGAGGTEADRPLALLRRALVIGARVGVGFLAVVLTLVALVHVDAVATWVVSEWAPRVNPYPATRLAVARTELSWPAHLRVHDLSLTSEGGGEGRGPEASVGLFDVRLRLASLLRGRVEILDASLIDAALRITQGADSTWDALAPFEGTSDGDDATSFRSGPIRIDRARIEATFASDDASEPPDRLVIEELTARIGALQLGARGSTASLDTLHAVFLPPGSIVDQVSLEGRGRLSEDRLEVDGLTLRSGASDVEARGVLLLPADGARDTEEVDFTLSAAPLALRDVSGFMRGVDPAVEVRADVRVQGNRTRANVSGRATLSDGGTAELEGVFAPFFGPLPEQAGAPDEPRIVQRAEARVERLRLESLLGSAALGGVVDASASVDLTGPTPDALTGQFRAQVAGLTLGGAAVLPSSLSGTVEDGAADVEVVGGLGGWGVLNATLRGRPLDERPEITVDGSFVQAAGEGGEGRLESSGVRGLEVGFGAAASAGADGRLAPSGLRRLSVELGAGSYRGRSLAGGRVSASWADDTGTVEVAQPLGEGRLTVRATLRQTWSGLAALRAQGTVRVTGLDLESFVLDSAVLRPRLDGGTLTGTVEAWLGGPGVPGGALSADVGGRPFDDVPRLAFDRLTFSGLDLEPAVGLPTRLDGAGRGRLEGFDAPSARLEAEVELAPSRIGAMSVDAATLSLALERGRLDAEGEVTTPGGGIVLSGWARPFGDELELDVREARVRALDLAALLPDAAPVTDLNVDARLSLRGPTWRTLSGDGLVTVGRSTLGRGELTGGSIALEASDGVAVARGTLTSGQGSVRASARLSLLEGAEEVHAEGDLDLPDLASFLDFEYEVAVAGKVSFDWSAADGGLAVASELSGRVAGTPVDTLFVEASLEDSVFVLDTLRLRAEVGRADGGGALMLGTPGESAGLGTGGPPRGVTLAFQVLRPVSFGDLPLLGAASLSSATGRVEAGGVAGDRTAALAIDLGSWETDRTAGRSGRIRAAYGPREVALDVSLASARIRDTLQVVLRAEHVPTRQEGVLRRLEISSETGGDWVLASPAPYTWGDELGITGFELRSEDGRALVDGTISRVAENDLSMRLESAQLAAVGPLLGLQDVQMVADADVRLRGTAGDPRAEGVLSVEVGPREQLPARAEVELTLSRGLVSFDGRVRDPLGGELTLVGTLPTTLSRPEGERAQADGVSAPSPGELDLRVEGDALDLAWARALVPGGNVRDLEGTLWAGLVVRGTTDDPRLEGTVRIRGGLIQLAATSTRYQDLDLAATIQPGELRVDSLRARSGAGTAVLMGAVGLSGLAPTTLDLSARFDRFLAWNSSPVNGVVSGQVAVRGTVDEPWIEGRLNPEGSTINLDDVSTDESAQAVQLTEADYRMLEDYFGYTVDPEGEVSPTERLSPFGLRLSVSFDQAVFVTRFPQPRVSLECSGDLELDKEPGGPLRVVGSVSVLPERSYFRQFGRRFAIDEGTLTLDGDPADYAVAARARWELPSYADPDQPEVLVNLDVSATSERLDLTLSSEPPMDESEIVSYLATGQAQGIVSSGDPASATNIGVAAATGAVAGVLEGLAADRIALDVVEIAVDPVRGTTLVAGRYVSPDVYLGFRQSVSFGDDRDRSRTDTQLTEVEIEYRWFRWLTANLQTSASELRFYLRSRHDY